MNRLSRDSLRICDLSLNNSPFSCQKLSRNRFFLNICHFYTTKSSNRTEYRHGDRNHQFNKNSSERTPSTDHWDRRDSYSKGNRGKAPTNSNSYNYRSRNEDNQDFSEPIYGRYDGDHLFGVSPVRLALLQKKRTIDELIIQEGMDLTNKKDAVAASDILRLAKELNVPIREFSKHDLNMMAENRPHQGFILRAQPIEYQPLARLEQTNNFKCYLALDEVFDPMNLGALLRTSLFLGCEGVIVCAKNSAPLSPTVSKASSGAMEVLAGKERLFEVKNMMRFLDESREHGWKVVGTSLSPRSVPLNDLTLDLLQSSSSSNPRSPSAPSTSTLPLPTSSLSSSSSSSSSPPPVILVLGNEGHGIRTNILNRCDILVRIPSFSSSSFSTHQTTPSISHTPSLSPSLPLSDHPPPGINKVDPPSNSNDEQQPVNDDDDIHVLQFDSQVSNPSHSLDSDGVDSLNVSVTGGILLNHLLNLGRQSIVSHPSPSSTCPSSA